MGGSEVVEQTSGVGTLGNSRGESIPVRYGVVVTRSRATGRNDADGAEIAIQARVVVGDEHIDWLTAAQAGKHLLRLALADGRTLSCSVASVYGGIGTLAAKGPLSASVPRIEHG
jgi:hypothetical protein